MVVIFWISLIVLFYTYIGYGLLLALIRIFTKNKKVYGEAFLPAVTVIVPAYNEELVIEQKLQNCLSLNYPQHLLSFLVITDGSTDATPLIVKRYRNIKHLFQPERKGKTAALNRAMKEVTTPMVVFTDANTMLHPECLQKMMQHYRNERVGGVSGEKRIMHADHTAVGAGERIYWMYESLLKKADASFYTVVGAAGELFSIRTALFEPLNEDIILDDFVLSAQICLKGYRFAYEEDAYAVEASSLSIAEERKRKVRISAGNFQALVLLKDLLNPVKNWRLTFQYFSHRVLRWTACPVMVLLLFISNMAVIANQKELFYWIFWWVQCSFYLLAVMGWVATEKRGFPRLLFIPYYFFFMNLSLLKGFYQYLTNQHTAIWRKAARKTLA